MSGLPFLQRPKPRPRILKRHPGAVVVDARARFFPIYSEEPVDEKPRGKLHSLIERFQLSNEYIFILAKEVDEGGAIFTIVRAPLDEAQDDAYLSFYAQHGWISIFSTHGVPAAAPLANMSLKDDPYGILVRSWQSLPSNLNKDPDEFLSHLRYEEFPL